jgi:hypothetical protein
MNMVLRLNQLDPDNIQFLEKKLNNKTLEGDFVRILYSNEHITLNGLYLAITPKFKSMIKADGAFDLIQENLVIINQLIDLERRILDMYQALYLPNHPNVLFNMDITDQLNKQIIHFKIAPKLTRTFEVFKINSPTVLRIIGVEELADGDSIIIGLKYAFLQMKTKLL